MMGAVVVGFGHAGSGEGGIGVDVGHVDTGLHGFSFH